jgi:hypothetical protein
MIRNALQISLAMTLLLACGGGGATGPTALAHRYDEVHIAQFSLDEKKTVLDAQNEFQRARAEQMKAEAELKESKTLLEVAKNERKQALIAEQSALQEKRAADDSGDMNRINAATRDMHVAELSRRAADDKVAYLKVHRKFLKKLTRYRQEETYHREARYEHEKAKLGQAKNIAPRGVKYESFKGQTDNRSRRAQKAKQDSESYKQKSIAAEKTWKGRMKEADQAKGQSSSKTSSSSSSDESSDSRDESDTPSSDAAN